MRTIVKKYIIFVFLLPLLVLSACGTNSQYELMHATEAIVSVKIVELVDYNYQAYRFEEKELDEIMEIDEFITTLKEIPCTRGAIPPDYLEVGQIVIKITYDNGDFELVHADSQSRFDVSEGIDGLSYEYKSFDEDSFLALLD